MDATGRAAAGLIAAALVILPVATALADPTPPEPSVTEQAPFHLAELEPEDATPQVAPSADDLQPVQVNDPEFRNQWYLGRTRVPQAWQLTKGTPEITVAVIDTGIDPFHLDLDGAFWQDPVDGRPGRDYLEGSPNVYGSPVGDWHGTAVAGVLGARADDGYGVAGVAPEVSVMAMRIYSSTTSTAPPRLQGGYGSSVTAIEDAKALGADVILLTWNGQDQNFRLRNAIANAGVPVVIAAGNDGVDLSSPDTTLRRYPALYNTPNAITVTASNLDDGVWSEGPRLGANLGAQHVDIAAPGELIYAPWAGNGHRYHSGTSFAAPQVAGALALALSLVPRAAPAELVGELVRTARPVPAFATTTTSGGILDVAAFLSAVQRPACVEGLPVADFDDVVPGSTHAISIDCISAFGLAAGTSPGRFSPSQPVTRGQMATFLSRTLARAGALPEPSELDTPATADDASFTDTFDTTHAATIEALTGLGIAHGFADGTFGPNVPVDRAQMATFLVRTVEHLSEAAYAADRAWFDDIAGTTHEDNIGAARELAITFGSSEPRVFDPRRTLTRAQMSSLLARTLDAIVREGVEVTRPSSADG